MYVPTLLALTTRAFGVACLIPIPPSHTEFEQARQDHLPRGETTEKGVKPGGQNELHEPELIFVG